MASGYGLHLTKSLRVGGNVSLAVARSILLLNRQLGGIGRRARIRGLSSSGRPEGVLLSGFGCKFRGLGLMFPKKHASRRNPRSRGTGAEALAGVTVYAEALG